MAGSIDPLSALMAPNNGPSTQNVGATGGASKDEFLKLLVAQLQYQDPLSPQNNTQFVAELAQFSTLEQATQQSQQLADIAAGQVAAQRASYANFLGKTVTSRSSSVTLNGQGAPPLTAHLDAPASKVQLVVSDVKGNEVAIIDQPAQGAGDAPLKWDGTDGHGHVLPAGTYQIALKATGSGGAAIAGYFSIKGVVSGLEFAADGAHFRVGGASVSPADIISVN